MSIDINWHMKKLKDFVLSFIIISSKYQTFKFSLKFQLIFSNILFNVYTFIIFNTLWKDLSLHHNTKNYLELFEYFL